MLGLAELITVFSLRHWYVTVGFWGIVATASVYFAVGYLN
ncbi:hypothetical protein KIPB_014972, partial [Kipferlia bialata]|eukprot:g14972.t1